jgi:broad specificity phosphatase PhoE
MTAHLILICQASTDAVRRSAFPADEPLDRHGLARAAALAKHMPAADRYRTSPELRTRQTAEALGLEATPLPMLRDCDYGEWTGFKFEEVLARDPEAISKWLRDPAAAPHGGESILSMIERVADWLEAEASLDYQSIVVTHASIIRAAIVYALEATAKSFWRIDIAPLTVTRLSGRDGRWNVSSAGCTISSAMS